MVLISHYMYISVYAADGATCTLCGASLTMKKELMCFDGMAHSKFIQCTVCSLLLSTTK